MNTASARSAAAVPLDLSSPPFSTGMPQKQEKIPQQDTGVNIEAAKHPDWELHLMPSHPLPAVPVTTPPTFPQDHSLTPPPRPKTRPPRQARLEGDGPSVALMPGTTDRCGQGLD